MKQITSLLIVAMMLSSCNFINNIKEKIPFFKSASIDTLLAYQLQLDSIRVADSIAAIEKARQDSISMANQAKEKPVVGSGKYHLVVASFKDQQLAGKYVTRMSGLGYEAKVIAAADGYSRVSIESFSNFNIALDKLMKLRREDKFQVWLYEAKN